MGEIVDVPLLLRERLGEDFDPGKIVGYRYSIGYITEDRDYPIENYYCEKEEYWADDKYRNLGEKNALEELKNPFFRWGKELIGPFDSKRRGYYDQFYKADNGQWPTLCWARIDVFIVDGNNEETIRIETKDRVEVVYGAFEGLRLWLEELLNYSIARHKLRVIFTLTNGRVHVKDIYVGQPLESAKKILLEQNFTVDRETAEIIYFKGYLDSLGLCNLKIWGNNIVAAIYIFTEKRFTEEEMMEVFEQVKVELHSEPGYDYNGYGVSPKPHEVHHFWDLNEGLVWIRWDGYNVNMFSHNLDGADKINLEVLGPVVKDEVYWRSEVD